MIKLVAMDLDGTLLDNRSLISQKNRKTIERCLAKGIKIAVVTGQALCSAVETINDLGLKGPHVLSNGAVAVNQRLEKLYSLPLGADPYRSTVKFCRQQGLQLMVSTVDGRILFDDDLYGLPQKDRMVKVNDLMDKAISGGVLLATIMTREGQKVDLKASCVGNKVKVRQAGLNYINIFNPKAGKTYGLKKILEYLQLSPKQVMAIGDGENDLGMIKMAGIGVAMGNASGRVKEAADFVTLENDRDGFSLALKRFLNI